MERKFNKGDVVQHFKKEKMTEQQLNEEPNNYKKIMNYKKSEGGMKILY